MSRSSQLRFSSFAISAALVGISVTTFGCSSSGPELGKVTGIVKLDGQPLSKVMVEFQPVSPGSPSIAYTDEYGRYQLRFSRDRWGALLGQHVVRINYDSDGRDSGGNGANIPADYNIRSQLHREVASGRNTHDFELSSRGSLAQAQAGR